jgi:hypothetical protein
VSEPFHPTSEPPGPPTAPSPPPKPKRGPLIVILLVVLGVCLAGAAAVAIIGVLRANHHAAAKAKVGDCFSTTIGSGSGNASNETTVACTATNAGYQVVALVPGKTRDEFQHQDLCTSVKQADSKLWLGPDGGKGTVFCVRTLQQH